MTELVLGLAFLFVIGIIIFVFWLERWERNNRRELIAEIKAQPPLLIWMTQAADARITVYSALSSAETYRVLLDATKAAEIGTLTQPATQGAGQREDV